MSATNDARATIATGESIDVRRFSVRQAMSELFDIELEVLSKDHDIDFDEVIGNAAGFSLAMGGEIVSWTGVASEMEQLRVDGEGLATYRLVIVPRAWLMTQRKTYRIFQYLSELEIVQQLLGEWGIEQETRASGDHKERKFRVQYGETDFDFASRMLEDAGISYYFEQSGEGGTKIVLDDAPETRGVSQPTLKFHDEPAVTDGRFVTNVAIRSRLRPGTMRIGDLDFRRGSEQQPTQSVTIGLPQEKLLEQFDYEPGAFLFAATSGGNTPAADDRGAARTDEGVGKTKTTNRLLGKRNDASRVSFDSDVLALVPGTIFSVIDHPHRVLEPSGGMLVVGATIEAEYAKEWRVHVDSVRTSLPYRPGQKTPKPVVHGLESATVVGPSGEEIHTDEYARVRVHFHWDRESKRNEASSCWLPTNQPWAGQSYGAINLPRVGQEVFVEFLAGDPDRPVVIGRVYTDENPTPDPLPKYKHVATLFSEATPRLVMGAAGSGSTTSNLSPYGGTPMSPQQVSDTVTQSGPFQAVSPTGTNHTWKGSGMRLDDMSNKENLYIQANKDLHMVVYNNWTTVVGNHRATKIGTDDVTFVKADQAIRIDNEQKTTVTKDCLTTIWRDRNEGIGKQMKQTAKGEIVEEAKSGNLLVYAKKAITIEADEHIQFQVGKSLVQLTPNDVATHSAEHKLQINPEGKQDPANSVPGAGQTPAEQAESDKADADEAAAKKAVLDAAQKQIEDKLRQAQDPRNPPEIGQNLRQTYQAKINAINNGTATGQPGLMADMARYGLDNPQDVATVYQNALNNVPAR